MIPALGSRYGYRVLLVGGMGWSKGLDGRIKPSNSRVCSVGFHVGEPCP